MKKYIIASLFSLVATSFAAPPVLTGKCGGVLQMQRKLFTNKDYNGKTVDAMVHLDFDTNTISMQSNEVSLPSNFPNGETQYVFVEPRSAPMTISAEKLPNSYRIVIPNFDGIMYLMSVNSGNTFLVQGYNDHISGVCQKI